MDSVQGEIIVAKLIFGVIC